MPQEPLRSKRLRCALLAACAAALLVASGAGIARAGDDDEDVPYDTKIMRGVMHQLGLQAPGDGSSIDYRERSPLVVPPTRDLPPPEAAAPAPKVANWPVDPDEKKRKEAIAARKKAANVRHSAEEEQKPLRPTDLNVAGGQPAAASGRDDTKSATVGDRSSVFDLGYKGDLFSWNTLFAKDKGEIGKFTSEPPRADLTEPPVGYRTPSPAQPYGLMPKADGPRKATDIFDRMTPVDSSAKQ